MTGPSTTEWLAGWLPAVEPATTPEQRARRLRAGLAQLDEWERAIATLRVEWEARLEHEAPAS